jgi:tight adherence protein B
VGPALLFILLVAGAAAVIAALVRGRVSSQSSQRLRNFAAADVGEESRRTGSHLSRVMTRYRWVAALATVSVSATMVAFTSWSWLYIAALTFLSAMIGWQAESVLHQRRLQRVEQQLADSIDMMVASVKAGASLQGALESALNNSPRPWKSELEEIVGRIRYGDDPVAVFADLSERLPLETIRLFAQTLAVNWSVGGRMAVTLANVSRTIRDRLELSRRMTAMTTQGRLSVLIILIVTYFIAALIWRNDPDRMASFLGSTVGQVMTAAAILLQGLGVVWIARLCQPRF